MSDTDHIVEDLTLFSQIADKYRALKYLTLADDIKLLTIGLTSYQTIHTTDPGHLLTQALVVTGALLLGLGTLLSKSPIDRKNEEVKP